MEVSKFMDMYDLDVYVDKIKVVYVKCRDVMFKIMEEEFLEGLVFIYLEGGLFIWVEFLSNLNVKELMLKCLDKNVVYVVGGGFFFNGGRENIFRFNYLNMLEEKIIEGIKNIVVVLKEVMGVEV